MRSLALLLVLLLALVACEGGGASSDVRDDAAVPDVAADPGVDPGADPGPGPDAVDVAPDLPSEAADTAADPGTDATPDVTDATPDATDTAGDAPDYSGVAILERPAEVTVTCSKVHDAVQLTDTWAGWQGADVAALGADVLMVRAEPTETATAIVASTIALDATLGTPHTLAPLPAWSWTRLRTATGEGVVGAVYAVGDATTHLELLTFDAAGVVKDGPVTLTGSMGLSTSSIVATAGGFAVLAAGDSGGTLRLFRLDVHGAGLGSTDLATAGDSVSYPAPRLLAVEGGFVAAWTENSAGQQVAALARLDALGKPLGVPVRMAVEGRGIYGPAVVAVEGGYLVAWAESYSPPDWNQSGWSVVMVQRFTAALAPVGEPARVQDPTEAITCHTPVWLDVAPGTPALSFDCGVLYTICAGCVPTETLGVVALHPDTLVPASQKVLLKAPAAGGLLNPRYVRQGSDWWVYADLTFHALTAPSLAALHCL